jgi:hypothetical protein
VTNLAFRLGDNVVQPLQEALPVVSGQVIRAITEEVPAYREAFTGALGPKLSRAVGAALGTFLLLLSEPENGDSPMVPALEGAYTLGKGEARNGRPLEALLAAYRIGARVAWRELSAVSVRAGESSATIAHFAELVFAYIDELSAASVTGHADQLAVSGRERQRRLERLAQALLAGEPPQVVHAAAELAEWQAPQTLTAVLLPEPPGQSLIELLDARTLQVPGEGEGSVLLVADASRVHLLRLLSAQRAVCGPARPWLQVRDSLDRAIRVAGLAEGWTGVIDTEDHLVELVVRADARALADLREKALAPLAAERDSSSAKLVETLRSWLLHQGHREDVAAELFVHPQTVRYRMSRLRELYGDRLKDPQWLLMLTIALAVAPSGPVADS